MSWFNNLVNFGKNLLTGNGLGSQILKTVVTGYALNRVQRSINKANEVPTQTQQPAQPRASNNVIRIPASDQGVRITGLGDVNTRIPVVYGSAFVGGSIVDAEMTNGNTVMWYALTLCERTGRLGLGTGAPSSFAIGKVYYNNQRVQFLPDGVTVDYCVDVNGNVDFSLQGLVKIYYFAGNSSTPIAPRGYTLASPTPAFQLFPTWTPAHQMNDIVFMLVRLTYNRDQGITGIGNIRTQVINSMNLPGDCLFDYMTNTRYGAGIRAETIKGL